MNYQSLAIAFAVIGTQAIQVDSQDARRVDYKIELPQAEADVEHFTHYGLAQMEDAVHDAKSLYQENLAA